MLESRTAASLEQHRRGGTAEGRPRLHLLTVPQPKPWPLRKALDEVPPGSGMPEGGGKPRATLGARHRV